ncbi:MAG: hypothetical protein WC334_11100 [Kiritimatiellales bacterium]|jgi:hypothetical protein
MKKIAVSMVVITLAFAVQSGIVNGDFSAGAVAKIFDLKSAGEIGKGWYSNDGAAPCFEFSRGSVTLNTVEPTSRPAVIGQLFTCGETGERSLNFDVSVVDGNANLGFSVQLYGYKQLTKEKTILFGNALKLENTEPPVTTEYYAVTPLVNYTYHTGTLSNGNFVTKNIKFDARADYALYGIRIMANRPDAADKVSFDNISITKPPESDSAVKP